MDEVTWYVPRNLHDFLHKRTPRQIISPTTTLPTRYIAVVDLPLYHDAGDYRITLKLSTFYQPRDRLVNRPGVCKRRMSKVYCQPSCPFSR